MYYIFSSFHAYDTSFLLAQISHPDALRNRYRKFYKNNYKVAISCRVWRGHRTILLPNNNSLLSSRLRSHI